MKCYRGKPLIPIAKKAKEKALKWTSGKEPIGNHSKKNFTPPVKQWCGETLGDLEPDYHLFTSAITLPQSVTVTYVDYAPNSTIRREEPYETLKDQNHKKSWDLGKRSVWKWPKRKHLEWKEPSEMLNRGKPLTTIAGPKKAKEKALKWTSQTGKEPTENHSEKNRALQIAKKNKTTDMKF